MVDGPELIQRAADSQVRAAWMQAFGAIAALFVAVGIPFYQALGERKRRKQKAKALALIVMSDVVLVRDRLDMVLNQSSLSPQALLHEGIDKMIVVPPELLAARPILHELGAVSETIIRMVAIMQMTALELDNLQIMARSDPEALDTFGDADKVRGGLEEIAELAAESSNRIGTLIGEEPIVLRKREANW